MKTRWPIQLIALLTTWTAGNLHGEISAPIPPTPPAKQSMWYVSPALAVFDSTKSWTAWPLVGLGYRWQSCHQGVDTSCWFTIHPEGAIISKVDCLWHYIPRPNLKSQWYVGAGAEVAAMSIIGLDSVVGAGPTAALGYQYQTSAGSRRFAQVQASTFVWNSEDGLSSTSNKTPYFTISYGFGF